MTTAAENEILTRVGPGTPMGELMRRYWWPVGISEDLKNKPTYVRLLGEDLVLFRDWDGQAGVLAALCSHRRANLCFGTVGQAGLRCRYHGWCYDTEGHVLDTPGEPRDSQFKDTLRHPAYPVAEMGGLIFTYLGPQPTPLLPRFDFLVGEGERYSWVAGVPPCNWLQGVENGMDPVHVSFLHGDLWADLNAEPDSEFEESEYGVVYKSYRPGPREDTLNYREHHLLLPGISVSSASSRLLESPDPNAPTAAGWNAAFDERIVAQGQVQSARWSVPIDDTHTLMIRVTFKPASNPGRFRSGAYTGTWTPVVAEPFKEYKDSPKPTLGYEVPSTVPTEDATIVCSMGGIVERAKEHLMPVSDHGVSILRRVYLAGIETVKAGGDPKGVIRDEAQNQIIPVPCREVIIPAAAHAGR
jgi:5,5'-dehydrodivanillate O-demethylase